MKKLYAVFLILFMLLCLIPSVGMLAFGESKPGYNEIQAQSPHLIKTDGRINTDFLSDLTRYIADNFAFRQELITMNSLVYAVFNTSASPKVILGENGWLYYADTYDDYYRTAPMTDRDIFAAAHTLRLLSDICNESGTELLFVPVPNKNTIYGEYMPNLGAPLANEDNAERLFEVLAEKSVDYIDLTKSLQEENMYFKMDSHWNARGAAAAADAILRKIGKEADFSSGDFTDVKKHTGDLSSMLFPSLDMPEQELEYRGFTFTTESDTRGGESIKFSATNEKESGKLLMFRDSFGNSLYPYMAQSFAASEFSRATPYNLIDLADFDNIVIEMAQRNIPALSKQAPIIEAPQVFDVEYDEEAEIRVEMERFPCELTGFVKLTGFADVNPDVDSPVYIDTGEAVYSAFPVSERSDGCSLVFTAYLSESLLEDVCVIFKKNNQYISIKEG